MFTGLISDVGKIKSIERSSDSWSLSVGTSYDVETLKLGESIAIDGACLTVTSIGRGSFSVDASPETLKRTTLGDRKVGDAVHLERALRVGDRLGGHLVLGHVDAVGVVRKRTRDKNAWMYTVEAPDEVAQYLIDKGSITVDGVSLTVNEVSGNQFGLAIIPHTAQETRLAEYTVGQRVNLEADVLGKYVKKLTLTGKEGLDAAFLDKFGFGELDHGA